MSSGTINKEHNTTNYLVEHGISGRYDNDQITSNGRDIFRLSETKVRYRGRYETPTIRETIPEPMENDCAYIEQSNTFHLYQGGAWSNTGSAQIPVVASDQAVPPDVTSGFNSDWVFATPQIGVMAEHHGMSEFNQDNSEALKSAIDEGKRAGLPVIIRPSVVGYRIVGDIEMHGGYDALVSFGSGARLNFFDGGLHFNARASAQKKQWAHVLDLITLERKGSVGPALKITAADQKNIIRWAFKDVRVLESTGHGVQIEGTYLCSFLDLYVFGCAGNGVHIDSGTEPDSFNELGVNALSITGGELQSSAWGLYCSDVKVLKTSNLTIEGNREGGVWIHRNNISVTLSETYMENNASQREYDAGNPAEDESYCDVRVGDPDPNVAKNIKIKFDGGRWSDGGVGHRRAAWIEDGQLGVVFDGVVFHAYGGAPIALIRREADGSIGSPRDTTTVGYISNCFRTNGSGLVTANILFQASNADTPRAFIDRTVSDLSHAVEGLTTPNPVLSLENPADSSFVISASTLQTRIHRIGRFVYFYANIRFTANVNAGTGDFILTIPELLDQLDVHEFPINVSRYTSFIPPNNTTGMNALFHNDKSIRFQWAMLDPVTNEAQTVDVNGSHLEEGGFHRLYISGSYVTDAL